MGVAWIAIPDVRPQHTDSVAYLMRSKIQRRTAEVRSSLRHRWNAVSIGWGLLRRRVASPIFTCWGRLWLY